jgi:hypothetical protein
MKKCKNAIPDKAQALECLRNPKIVDLSTGRESTTRPKVPYFVPERDQ